jgi:hypothetical protein
VAEDPRLTRRDVLSGAAAIGAGALLGPAAVARAGRVASHADVFAHRVGALAAGEVRTIALPRAVCLAAARWSGPGDGRLTLRSRRSDGRWGRWAVASSGGHDGDGVMTPDHVGEGVWLGRATELQLRSRGQVHQVTLQCVAAEPDDARAAAPDGLPVLPATLPAGLGQPPIIARAAWAGSNHAPKGGPYYGAIEMGIVHHTENPNGYSPAEVPAMLRAIYAYHVHGRGWLDIGYNFVIDRFGRIWEARQGGIDLPVLGAQAGDWNQISFGVALLGTYTDVRPSAGAVAALERLLAWKLALNGLPAVGELEAVASGADISYTQFRAGQQVRFPRIAGHRQVDATDCPGDAFFAELPAIRHRVQGMLGAEARLKLGGEITLFADGPVAFFSGVLTQQGVPLPGAAVELERIVGHAGAAETVATLTTAADGSFTSSLPATAGLLVRAVRTTAPAAVSNVLGVGSLQAATS